MKETNVKNIKDEAIQQVDSSKNQLIGLSLRLHDNPELGYKEEKAVEWLCAYLKENGFELTGGIAGLPTAFKAKYGSGSPVIALLAEYDALPELGHACGHNIIAAASIGAGVASKSIVDTLGGTVIVYGTPAEEVFGGKIDFIEQGIFEEVDVAMLTHPDTVNSAVIKALGCAGVYVEFIGKSAHAAAEPEMGINALDAMILTFNNINALRQQIKSEARIHGIIKHGGNAANIIPDYTSASFMVRSYNRTYLDELRKKIVDCFMGAAIATGCQVKYTWDDKTLEPMKNNMTMAKLFNSNMSALGRNMEPFDYNAGFGSTDMGNVSQVVPAIHPTVKIAEPGVATHSKEFAIAAASEHGHKGLLDAAKAMAMTVADILGNPELIAQIKSEFDLSINTPSINT
jgi:amidohydrolase